MFARFWLFSALFVHCIVFLVVRQPNRPPAAKLFPQIQVVFCLPGAGLAMAGLFAFPAAVLSAAEFESRMPGPFQWSLLPSYDFFSIRI
jgi:hypothetical protein